MEILHGPRSASLTLRPQRSPFRISAGRRTSTYEANEDVSTQRRKSIHHAFITRNIRILALAFSQNRHFSETFYHLGKEPSSYIVRQTTGGVLNLFAAPSFNCGAFCEISGRPHDYNLILFPIQTRHIFFIFQPHSPP